MRCQEKTGFLMLRRCENTAETECSVCGKRLCNEHTFALSAEQIALLNVQPTSPRVVACLECFRKTQPQQAQQTSQVPNQGAFDSRQRGGYNYDNDPYYRYPYYGSYHPYIWGSDFSDRDRHVFNRNDMHTGDNGTDSTLDS